MSVQLSASVHERRNRSDESKKQKSQEDSYRRAFYFSSSSHLNITIRPYFHTDMAIWLEKLKPGVVSESGVKMISERCLVCGLYLQVFHFPLLNDKNRLPPPAGAERCRTYMHVREFAKVG